MSALGQPAEADRDAEIPSALHLAAPPRELDAAVDAAARRAESLAAADRELNFVVDAAGALRVEVRDLAGRVLRVVSASQAVAIMGGLGRP